MIAKHIGAKSPTVQRQPKKLVHAARIVSSVRWVLSAPQHSLASNWLTTVLRGALVDTLVEPPAPATLAAHDVDEALAAIGSLTDEVQRVITGLPNNKALGMDQISAELLKGGLEITSNEWALLFDWILRTGDVPAAWRGGRLARLF